MYQYDTPRSFIAYLRSSTATHKGKLGSVELSYSPLSDHTTDSYGSWLTVSNFPGAPGQLFWFGALNVANVEPYYEIRTFNRAPNTARLSHDKRLDWSSNRYIGLYTPTDTPGPFWSLSQRVSGGGIYEDVMIISENNQPLKPYGSSRGPDGLVSHYLNDEEGSPLSFTLEVAGWGFGAP
ncbi:MULTISPECIES: hypothetical protein [Pseudomonas]|uniref:Uncharacterized protein n=1 Tax=Pseudomonas fluorescens TaxID=294 RepID=A0A5E6V898_PSEFL|nr:MULTISPECIES: hypothetical protein [Pseudomonas]VVN11434.1 hypothetical protein PS652_03828 [Pseudomonas fluorescens]